MPTDPNVREVTTTVGKLVDYSRSRTNLLLFNKSSTTTVYIGNTTSMTTSRSFPIPPGSTLVFSGIFGDDPTLARFAITSAGTADIAVIEEYKQEDM